MLLEEKGMVAIENGLQTVYGSRIASHCVSLKVYPCMPFPSPTCIYIQDDETTPQFSSQNKL